MLIGQPHREPARPYSSRTRHASTRLLLRLYQTLGSTKDRTWKYRLVIVSPIQFRLGGRDAHEGHSHIRRNATHCLPSVLPDMASFVPYASRCYSNMNHPLARIPDA